MLKWLGSLVDSNEKELKRLESVVTRINSLEAEIEKLTNAELQAKTDEFKNRLKAGETLDELLPEAFAVVREAAKRTIGERHFDVQLMGGIALHQGKIAEMKTGEGKTLVATLPLYLNSLTGNGCHLVTVNDYLARRDCQWMGPIYHLLGVSVACIHGATADNPLPSFIYDPDSGNPPWQHLRPVTRRQAYEADITYGTNNEFGFDYLRDNMVLDLSQCVQHPLNYAIVDEVDNILIDEARTPLIISIPIEEAVKMYDRSNPHLEPLFDRRALQSYTSTFTRLVPSLSCNEDYTIDEKSRRVDLTDDGISKMERLLRKEGMLKGTSIYDPANYGLVDYMKNALRAQVMYKKDRDYVVKEIRDNNRRVDKQVIIVDEFTGRLMFGRRYSDGLHEAIEAKEGVTIRPENVSPATITFQNYFRMYQKLAGMTGTAATEAEEFFKIYKLDVVVIPTYKPMIRQDHPDQVYKDEQTKFKAAAREIEELRKKRQPVLIGTVSIEKSEHLSDLLTRRGIPHEVLNANTQKEAAIIAQAGRVGAVTVATNMAGRGVDIILGGNPAGREHPEWQEEHNKVVELGGLHVIGTERHEARRIDNQLRGRSGRQGDPGSSRFYVSLEDDVVRRFGGDRVKSFMDWAGFDENTPIEHSMVNKAIENAQVKVEGYHFDIRKHLVEYDDVVNKHREVIYAERKKILSGADLKANILSMVHDEIRSLTETHLAEGYAEPEIQGLLEDLATMLPPSPELNIQTLSRLSRSQIIDKLTDYAEKLYEQREQEIGTDIMRTAERWVILRVIDRLWVRHLTIMERMRQGISLHGMAQRDPLIVYRKEGYNLFESLLANIQHDVAHTIYKVNIVKEEKKPPPKQAIPVSKRVGRNDPCPCGSGKKYKKCCGR